jgi:cell division protein FtsB
MEQLLPFLGALGVLGALMTAFVGALMFQSNRAKSALENSSILITQSKMLSDRMLEDYHRMRTENESLHAVVEQLTEQNIELGRQVKLLELQVNRLTDHRT